MLNVLTVDVEDYFSVETFRHIIRYEDWDRYAIRVDIGLRRILDLLERYNVTATFFVLGWMAARRPDVVRDIHRRGHEIACHGYRHQMIHAQSRGEFREDIHRAKAELEDLISEPVVGYRAPTFSITQRTLWALSILAEEGYRYDSSIYPIVHDRYGIPAHTRVPHWIDLPAGRRILELPLATGVVAGRRIPFGGGGYLRIYPLWLTMWLLRRLNGGEGRPAVIYVHPWELDPEQPRQPVALLGRFRNYYNLERTHDRLEVLLRGFRFGSVRELVRQTAISERISLLEGVDPAPGDGEIAARPPVV